MLLVDWEVNLFLFFERFTSKNTEIGSYSSAKQKHLNTGGLLYIHGSEHRGSILIRSNKMQQEAGTYLLQIYSTCFGCPSHPSSGVHETVTTASGRGHSNRSTTFLQRGLIRSRWRKVVVLLLWPVPEATVTVSCTPDDGCDGHPKHVEYICSK